MLCPLFQRVLFELQFCTFECLSIWKKLLRHHSLLIYIWLTISGDFEKGNEFSFKQCFGYRFLQIHPWLQMSLRVAALLSISWSVGIPEQAGSVPVGTWPQKLLGNASKEEAERKALSYSVSSYIALKLHGWGKSLAGRYPAEWRF